ncbi:MAG: hypothetical protein EOP84_03430 [Verrucomicrobiaceae bacterium]|nr:MAG: hypothetical protein EOP84_03430 [Verrucomicrobiaceae bacterium]
MVKIQENPYSCEIGEAYIPREGLELGEWDVLVDITGTTVYHRYSSGSMECRYFGEGKAEVDGREQPVMVREVDPHIAQQFDPRKTNSQCGGRWKYPTDSAGIIRDDPKQCLYGDLLPFKEFDDRMHFQEFHQDLYLARLYDWLEFAGKEAPAELEEFVFDLEDRMVDDVPTSYFVRVDLAWVETEKAERNTWQ